MSSKGFLNILLVILVVSSFSIPKISAQNQDKIDPAYVIAFCAKACVDCDEKVDILPPYNLIPLCKKGTYQDISLCRTKCTEKMVSEVRLGTKRNISLPLLAGGCEKCYKEKKCFDYRTADKNLLHCVAIEKDRDMVEFFQNQQLEQLSGTRYGCPRGAKLSSDGSTCECDEGMELDSLHTSCLDKKTITKNIEMLLLILPDDIRQTIEGKAKEHLIDSIKGFLPESFAGQLNLLSFFSEIISQDMNLDEKLLSTLIYNNFVQNTKNLRDLIKTLGRRNTEKLIEILGLITKGQERVGQKPSVTTVILQNVLRTGEFNLEIAADTTSAGPTILQVSYDKKTISGQIKIVGDNGQIVTINISGNIDPLTGALNGSLTGSATARGALGEMGEYVVSTELSGTFTGIIDENGKAKGTTNVIQKVVLSEGVTAKQIPVGKIDTRSYPWHGRGK